MFAAFDQSGEFLISGINPAAELIGYLGVIWIALNELAQSAYSEGLDTYVEDEAYQGIELLLGEDCIHFVDFGFCVLDVLFEEGFSCFFGYKHTLIDAVGVAVAYGPLAPWAEV